jgi:hypothetical protein
MSYGSVVGPEVKDEKKNEVKPTHDRRSSANVGYRVWNPFEIEFRVALDSRYDEAAKAFTGLIDVFRRRKERSDPKT